MTIREVTPWQSFEKASEDGLRRIAALCESFYIKEDSGAQQNVFGTSGLAVANEIHSFLNVQSKKAKKKSTKRTKSEDPLIAEEVAIIDLFIEESKKALGVPAIPRWGSDRTQIRRVLHSGFDLEAVKQLVPLFFKQANKNQFIFGKGDITSFIKALPKLAALLQKTKANTEVKISIPLK